jgi:integrase
MNAVDAITDENTLKLVPILLKKHYGQQFQDVWVVGVNLALRISDLLSIRYSDINNGRLRIKESKTNKSVDIPLNEKAAAVVEVIMNKYPDDEYLFQSRSSRNLSGRVKPLSRQSISAAFKDVGSMVDVQLSSHSLRKTRGYFLYKKTNDIARVSKMLRHSNTGVTLRYIGLTKMDVDSDFNELVL